MNKNQKSLCFVSALFDCCDDAAADDDAAGDDDDDDVDDDDMLQYGLVPLCIWKQAMQRTPTATTSNRALACGKMNAMWYEKPWQKQVQNNLHGSLVVGIRPKTTPSAN